ncbi:MAG: glutathione S-transferase family protein [Proteobacteria bacterium]|nr:glutathione S-transferase family protein [Pseudomonadota bacterium]
MIKLYGIPPSFPVIRVQLCLNAMELEYKFVQMNPLTGETQSEEYLKLSPSGKIPALEDDGFALFESNAIMKYLCRKHKSGFYPTDITAQANVDKWLDFTTIHLGNGVAKVLFNKILAGMLDAEVDEQSLKDGYAFIERFLGVIDKQLGVSTFVASNSMTIADFCLLGTIDPAEVIDVDITQYPNIDAWRKKLMQEPFYKKVHDSYGETLEKAIAQMS